MHKACCTMLVTKPVTGYPVVDGLSKLDQMSVLDEQAFAARDVLPNNSISLLLDVQLSVAMHMKARGLSVNYEEALRINVQCRRQVMAALSLGLPTRWDSGLARKN